MSTVSDNSLRMKLIVILQTGSSLIYRKKLLSSIVDLDRICIALRISMFLIGNDDNIRTNT